VDVVLVHFSDSGARRDFKVTAAECRVGRKPEADLQIPAPTVSRDHCLLRREGDRVLVRDLGSSNGTFRNGQRVGSDEVELRAGDRLTVGFVHLSVQIDGKPSTISPPPGSGAAKPKAAPSGARTAPATTLTRRASGAAGKPTLHDSGLIADLLSVDNDDSGQLDVNLDFGDDEKP
jgi:pSer/pThr/pTyr-binding forkhead associated (FHA) protein